MGGSDSETRLRYDVNTPVAHAAIGRRGRGFPFWFCALLVHPSHKITLKAHLLFSHLPESNGEMVQGDTGEREQTKVIVAGNIKYIMSEGGR